MTDAVGLGLETLRGLKDFGFLFRLGKHLFIFFFKFNRKENKRENYKWII